MIWILKRLPYYALTVMAAYAAYCMPPESNPYAFTSCAIGIVYGVFGLVGGQEVTDSIVKGVINNLQDFMPLAMVNIEIFKISGNLYALVHGLFLIPLILDLVAKLFGDASDDVATQNLKHVSNVANVVSLLYLAFMQRNYMFSCVALSFFSAHVGMVMGGKCHGYLIDLNYIVFNAMFYFATILAVTNPNKFTILTSAPSITSTQSIASNRP